MKKFVTVVMLVALTLSAVVCAQAEAMKTDDFARSIVKTSMIGAVQVDTELQEKADAAFGNGLSIQVKQIEINGISAGTIKYQAAETDSRSWIQKAWDFVTFWN